MMMGTAGEIAKAPEKGPVFMEDLPEEEQAVAVVSFITAFYLAISDLNIPPLSFCPFYTMAL